MIFTEKTFTDTSKITTNELKLIYIRFGANANVLDIIKGMNSSNEIHGQPNFHCADSSEGWVFLQRRFGKQLKGQGLNSIPELYSHMVNWCYENEGKY